MHYLRKSEGRDLVNEVVEYIYLLNLQALVKSTIWDWIMDYDMSIKASWAYYDL